MPLKPFLCLVCRVSPSKTPVRARAPRNSMHWIDLSGLSGWLLLHIYTYIETDIYILSKPVAFSWYFCRHVSHYGIFVSPWVKWVLRLVCRVDGTSRILIALNLWCTMWCVDLAAPWIYGWMLSGILFEETCHQNRCF